MYYFVSQSIKPRRAQLLPVAKLQATFGIAVPAIQPQNAIHGPPLHNYWNAYYLFCATLKSYKLLSNVYRRGICFWGIWGDMTGRCWSLISQEHRGAQGMFRSARECHDQCSWSHSMKPSNHPHHHSDQYLISMSSSHGGKPQTETKHAERRLNVWIY